MNEVFNYEFDGPVTRFTRYGEPMTRDEVLIILNRFVEKLRKIEAISAELAGGSRIYRLACEALNFAEVTE